MSKIQIQVLRGDEDGSVAEAFDQRADRIARMAEEIEGMMTTDVAMVASRGVEGLVRDWSEVSHVEISADPDTFECDGPSMTMRADLEIHFVDFSTIRRPVLVAAEDSDGIFGLRSIDTIVERTA